MKNHTFKTSILRYLKFAGLVTLLLWLFTGFFGCGSVGPVFVAYSASLDGQEWSGPLKFTVYNKAGFAPGGCYREAERTDTFNNIGSMDKVSRFGATTTYVSGGPEGAVFTGLFWFEEWMLKNHDGGSSQKLIEGKSDSRAYRVDMGSQKTTGCSEYPFNVSYGFVFRSPRTVNVDTMLDGKPWSGPVAYTLTSVINETIALDHWNVEKDVTHTYSLTKTLDGASSPQTYDKVTGDKITIKYGSGGPPEAKLDSITPSTLELKANETGTFTLNFVSNGTADLEVNATLDDEPWSGALNYAIAGPDTFSGSSVPGVHQVISGNYTAQYVSGGPDRAKLISITPQEKQEIIAETNDPATRARYGYTFNFESTNGLTIQAILDGKPWSGAVSYAVSGPELFTENSAPLTRQVKHGAYTVTYKSGGPPDAKFIDITPAASQDIKGGKDFVFTLNFRSASKIKVLASLDGKPWNGYVDFRILGPEKSDGNIVPHSATVYSPGDYSVEYVQGGPAGCALRAISPAAARLNAQEEAAFTLEFESAGEITVTGSFFTQPWAGQCSYVIDGPIPSPITGTEVPFTFTGLPSGEYRVEYLSGHPEGAKYHSVSPLIVRLIPGPDGVNAPVKARCNIKFVYDDIADPVFVASRADLSLTNTGTFITALNAYYTITVTNSGPDTATGVEVTLALPAFEDGGATHPVIPGAVILSQGSYAGGVWTIGDIPSGATVTLKINIGFGGPALTPLIPFTSTAEVTASGTADPDSVPNNAVPGEDDRDTGTITSV